MLAQSTFWLWRLGSHISSPFHDRLDIKSGMITFCWTCLLIFCLTTAGNLGSNWSTFRSENRVRKIDIRMQVWGSICKGSPKKWCDNCFLALFPGILFSTECSVHCFLGFVLRYVCSISFEFVCLCNYWRWNRVIIKFTDGAILMWHNFFFLSFFSI